MTKVIGLQESQELRTRRWNDLLESKRSYQTFRNSSDEQEQQIAAIDKDYYNRTLTMYVG